MSMATIHISATEAARDVAGLLARVRAGAEVVIEDGPLTVAVLHTPAPPRRSIEECIALLPEAPRRLSTRTSPAMSKKLWLPIVNL